MLAGGRVCSEHVVQVEFSDALELVVRVRC